MKMKSINEIEVHEVAGQELKIGESEKMKVESHPGRAGFIILKFGKEQVTVYESDLNKAITNASNV